MQSLQFDFRKLYPTTRAIACDFKKIVSSLVQSLQFDFRKLYPTTRTNHCNLTSENCIQLLAPRGKEVEVDFEEFSFRERLQQQSSSYYGRCVHERVEIRNTDYYNGNFYCGNDIEPGTRMTSQGGNFIIIISADDEMEGKGLKC
ncbi:hypothetical protein CEXT_307031 [Caerostris extrusa]|uniref:CUB domain-containing protein n=1 Tax=Caerostris extrusa TaxID=172846 RepID=A0AAV4XVQ6_CAEEX|nr:hypothetical protein CEXT_307031 [Caerostris extrusa]